MTIVTEYLAQAAHYIDKFSRSIVETLTDEQFTILVAATDEYSGGGTEPGIDSTLAKTHETIADYDQSRDEHWRESGFRETLDLDAPAVKYERVQLFKGETRRTFIVVDFGDYRVVVH